MIRVRVRKTAGQVNGFRVTGHGGYGEAGEDVVCAAVSALVLNAVNSCEHLLGAKLHVEDTGELLLCTVPAGIARAKDVQLLLESMLFGIEQTVAQYPQHVQLRLEDGTDEAKE